MPQCKAETASRTQCVSEVAAPSRSLCKRHQNVVAAGKAVFNFETGRKFPAPATQPRVAAVARTRAPAVEARDGGGEAALPKRGPGEHALVCDAARCGERALAGSDYCMKHQGLA